MDITSIITTALALIESVLPLLGGVGNATVVNGIIAALTKIAPLLAQLAPLIGDEAKLIYQGVRNIINNLRGPGVVTTAQQDADLDSLDAQVDASWNSVAAQFDPDFTPPAAPTV